MITEQDRLHLRRCVELAESAVEAGDEPFGSLLVSSSGQVLYEDRNRVAGGDPPAEEEGKKINELGNASGFGSDWLVR